MNLPDSNGRKIREIHPVLVISNDRQNMASPLMIVIPITSLKENEKVYSFQLEIELRMILVDQVHTIDRDSF